MHALSFPANPFVTAYRLRGGDPLTLTEFVRTEIAMLSRPVYTYYAKFTLLWSHAPTTAGRCTSGAGCCTVLYWSCYSFIALVLPDFTYPYYPCMLPERPQAHQRPLD